MGTPQAELPEQMCQVCKKEEITGAVFRVRLRTSKEREKVMPSVNVCDACSNLISRLLESPKLLEKLIKELLQ